MTFLRTPKGYTLAVLLCLASIAGFGAEQLVTWMHVTVFVGAAVLVDVALTMLLYRTMRVPDGAILTGLILAMVLSPITPWYMSALFAAVSILSKHLLKVGRKPIFNPAAVGLLIALISGSPQSWWGALPLLPAWTVTFLIAAGMLVAHRVNKLPLVFTFLGTYFGFLLSGGLLNLNGVGDAFRMPFVNAVLFLAFFMVTDPPTAPAKYEDQALVGIVAGTTSALVLITIGGLWFLAAGLWVANAVRISPLRSETWTAL
ncbi:MAG TPA: RnfABCDGE type electron transport complex subunit D [Symbiobacteriaceae bacterium]|jgi:Na+-translocating ferredoxin:NAD+ oxidoreductase RnfD subunit